MSKKKQNPLSGPMGKNPLLKTLYPPDITDEEKANLSQLPGQIYRYGPFVVISDNFSHSSAVDTTTDLSLTYEGTLDEFLKRLDALMPLYSTDFDDAPDHVFYPPLAQLIYNLEVMMNGEMAMGEDSDEDDLEDDFDDDDDYEDYDDFDDDDDDFGIPGNLIHFRPPGPPRTDD